jgi:hypothetical protein
MGKEGSNIVAITSDIDWAPDDVIKYMLSILGEYRIKITFFCTHGINVKEMKKHELAIHPNFTKDKTDEKTIHELMTLYPEAKGTRSHSLYIHSRLFNIYQGFGLEYDSNYILPGQIIEPFFIAKNILELPIFFEDDTHFLKSKNFDLNQFDLKRNGLKIFNFHPIHIFLNTQKVSDYVNAKNCLQEPAILRKYRNSDKGTEDMFIDLLNYLDNNDIDNLTLREVSDSYRR